MEKFKPVIVQYHKEKHKGRDKVIACCGRCGNTIEMATSYKRCKWCNAPQDWDGAPYYTRYALTEKACIYALEHQ